MGICGRVFRESGGRESSYKGCRKPVRTVKQTGTAASLQVRTERTALADLRRDVDEYELYLMLAYTYTP